MTDFEWKYGNNGFHEYYESKVNGIDLFVFKNKGEKLWMGMVDGLMIWDKEANNRERKKEGLPTYAPRHRLRKVTLKCTKTAKQAMIAVEKAYGLGVDEI